MKKIVLWLDDLRDPNSLFKNDNIINKYPFKWIDVYSPINGDFDVVWVKTYDEFVKYITENGLPDGICFDNDLGEEKEGYDCVKWLVNYCQDNNLKLPPYLIHSYNVVAKANMFSLINNFIKAQEK